MKTSRSPRDYPTDSRTVRRRGLAQWDACVTILLLYRNDVPKEDESGTRIHARIYYIYIISQKARCREMPTCFSRIRMCPLEEFHRDPNVKFVRLQYIVVVTLVSDSSHPISLVPPTVHSRSARRSFSNDLIL